MGHGESIALPGPVSKYWKKDCNPSSGLPPHACLALLCIPLAMLFGVVRRQARGAVEIGG
jgi:hypothetical protein